MSQKNKNDKIEKFIEELKVMIHDHNTMDRERVKEILQFLNFVAETYNKATYVGLSMETWEMKFEINDSVSFQISENMNVIFRVSQGLVVQPDDAE